MILKPFEKDLKRIHYSKFAFFVQKSNDLDTLSSALALCKVLTKIQGADCRIFNVNIRKSILPGLDRFREGEKNPMVCDEDTVAVLVDVNARKQIREREGKKIEKCGQVIRIDHHEVCDDLGMKMLNTTATASSCAEIVGSIIKNAIKDQKHAFKKDVAETCFYGIYADTQDLTTPSMNHLTFSTLAEISEIVGDISKSIKKLNRYAIPSLKLICEVVNEIILDGHLAIANLKPDIVSKYYPNNLRKDKTGRLVQKKLITFPLFFLHRYLEVDYIIFIHFSLFKPYENEDKVVFVVLNKENPSLEEELLKNGFHKNRDRFCNPEMKFGQLLAFIKENKELFQL